MSVYGPFQFGRERTFLCPFTARISRTSGPFTDQNFENFGRISRKYFENFGRFLGPKFWDLNPRFLEIFGTKIGK